MDETYVPTPDFDGGESSSSIMDLIRGYASQREAYAQAANEQGDIAASPDMPMTKDKAIAALTLSILPVLAGLAARGKKGMYAGALGGLEGNKQYFKSIADEQQRTRADALLKQKTALDQSGKSQDAISKLLGVVATEDYRYRKDGGRREAMKEAAEAAASRQMMGINAAQERANKSNDTKIRLKEMDNWTPDMLSSKGLHPVPQNDLTPKSSMDLTSQIDSALSEGNKDASTPVVKGAPSLREIAETLPSDPAARNSMAAIYLVDTSAPGSRPNIDPNNPKQIKFYEEASKRLGLDATKVPFKVLKDMITANEKLKNPLPQHIQEKLLANIEMQQAVSQMQGAAKLISDDDKKTLLGQKVSGWTRAVNANEAVKLSGPVIDDIKSFFADPNTADYRYYAKARIFTFTMAAALQGKRSISDVDIKTISRFLVAEPLKDTKASIEERLRGIQADLTANAKALAGGMDTLGFGEYNATPSAAPRASNSLGDYQ
jgi:hypothetical protein